jgi:23S rRNA pseudouridine2605 synthase
LSELTVPVADAAAADRGERLQRLLAAAGVASRRKAEELIRAGRVSVDGKVITELGTRVDPQQSTIRVDGRPIRPEPLRYIMLNKPSGFITTTSDERGRQTVMDLLPPGLRVFPVGRLDRDTEGLLLLTNDGDLANRVMHPRYELTKEYLVLTPLKPPPAVMKRIAAGVDIDGKRLVPHEFRIVRETPAGVLLSVVIHEGMNRVVRKMMESAGIPITHLRRVRVGPLSVAGIPPGAYRELTPGELTSLLQALRIDRGETSTRGARPTTGRARARVAGSRRPASSRTRTRGEPHA